MMNIICSSIFRFSPFISTIVMAIIVALITVIIAVAVIGTSRRHVQGESIFDLILFVPPKRMKLAQSEKLGEDKP